MKKIMIVLAGLLLSGATVRAAEDIAPSQTDKKSGGHFELGTRILYYQLRKDHESHNDPANPLAPPTGFIGSLTGLDENQDYAPTRLYLQYRFSPYCGIGVSYDKFEAKTLDSGGGDGDVGIEGPILYVMAAYPTESRFTPFAEVGVAFYHSYFDENSWADPQGAPARRMENDNTEALVLALGCDVAITENLSANLYLRMTDGADVDVSAWQEKADHPFRTGSFPMDYYAGGIGVKYAFK